MESRVVSTQCSILSLEARLITLPAFLCDEALRTGGKHKAGYSIPAPQIKTLLPKVTPPLRQAWIPTESGSMRAPSSKVTLSGSLQEPETQATVTIEAFNGSGVKLTFYDPQDHVCKH